MKNKRSYAFENYKSYGAIRYSPKLAGDNSVPNWWVVVDCDPDFGAYYRQLFFIGKYKTQKLQKPAWSEHISVVRNEEPKDKINWRKYDGKIIEFSYEPILKGDGVYCWISVECDFLNDLRLELSLPKNPIFPFHMTVGNIKYLLNRDLQNK